MLTMQSFFTKTALGLDISARSVTLGAVAWKKGTLSLIGSRTLPLAPGTVAESFESPSVADREGLAATLQSALTETVRPKVRRTGLSLPDALFRVQMIDLDELPAGHDDRERLIRWRLEKAAVFDVAGTVLRYQVSPREERGYGVLACVIKRGVLAEYEDMLDDLGLDPWNVAPASFHVLNLYAPAITARSGGAYALVWLAEGSYSTLIVERGSVRFYRYREIKASALSDASGRLTRELDDALHFYAHMDRNQRSEIGHVYLAGGHPAVGDVAEGLRSATSLEVDVLAPGAALPALEGADAIIAPMIGAGGAL